MRRILVLAFLLATSPFTFAQAAAPASAKGIDDVLSYISTTWTTLTRTNQDCKTFVDQHASMGKPVIYFPAGEPLPPIAADLQKRCNMDVRQLPEVITHPGQLNPDTLPKQGILFLPNPYVVPGGFFNEMYGWDSYFIVRGLLRADKIKLARGQVENFFYEIEHYGSILNANRTYFLSRSQPPFLSAMVMAVNDAEKQTSHQDDRAWLAKAYPFIVKDWEMWNSAPHLAGETGLSRYFDFGDGPSAEFAATGDPYYAEMITAVLSNDVPTDYFISDPKPGQLQYTISVCIDSAKHPCAKSTRIALTNDYYKGDRSMRESGFDPSSRFGPYSGHTHHYAAVGLNSLLYQTEKNLQKIATILGKPEDAKKWADRAQHRSELMNKYLWNAERGMYFDYDFMAHKQSDYNYATTFYPLWVGQASPDQAKALEANVKVFEQPGGVVMSTYDTHLQWDFPYGWAPVNLIDIEGLRAYGDDTDANRLSYKFLSMIIQNFRRDGTIREKYNMVTRSDETQIAVGYKSNLIGFGWTNGTFLALLHEMPQHEREALNNGKTWQDMGK